MSGFDPSSAKEFDPNSATEVTAAPAKAKPTSGVPQASAPLKPGVMFNNPNQKPAINTTALDNAGTNAGNAIGSGITGTLGLLQRVPDAWDALLTGGNAWHELSGSATPEEHASTQSKVTNALGKLVGGNPIVQGVAHAGMNPLNVVDLPLGAAAKGRSLGQLATDAVEGHSLPLAVKAGQAIASTGTVGQKATDALSKVHDFMGVHSAAKRELAGLNGPAWIDAYAKYRARLMQMGGKPDPALDAQAVAEAAAASKPAPAAAARPAYNPPKEAPRPVNPDAVPQGPAVFNGDHNSPSFVAGSRGSRPVNWPMQQAVKPNIKAADLAQTVADYNASKVAPAFSPEDQSIFDKMAPKSDYTGKENPLWNLISSPSDLMTAGIFAVPFGHMANISTLGALTDPLAVGTALTKGTIENARGLGGVINKASDNRLGFLGNGGETADQLATRMAPAQAGGAISSHAFERDNPLTGGLDAGSSALDSLAAGIKAKTPGPSALGAIAAAPVQALAMVPKALSGLYKASGNVLWKFDDEVKAQRFQNLVDGGMDPQRAGLRVGGELVDYENKAPIAGAIRPVAPFATWRTKAPLAVGRNILENPGKASALENLAPAAFGGDQGEDPESGKPYTSSLPPAELNTLLSDPLKYGKSTVSSPGVRLAGDLLGGMFEHGKRHGSGRADDTAMRKATSQFTGGLSPLDYILGRVPGLSQYLEYSGNGPYGNGSPPSLQSDVLSNLLVRPH